MPYIEEEQRQALDPLIDRLCDKMNSATVAKTDFCGILNYVVTQVTLKTIPERRYWAIAAATGALRNSVEEFYRRYVTPYEDEKIRQNGDVYPQDDVRNVRNIVRKIMRALFG